jgi:hypothetical protein
MEQEGAKESQKRPRADRPFRVNLPGFIKEEEIGLGDVIKRVTYAVGIAPCGGCERRAAALNRWLVFSRRHPS